jgi:hypothetical protein
MIVIGMMRCKVVQMTCLRFLFGKVFQLGGCDFLASIEVYVGEELVEEGFVGPTAICKL